MKRELDVLCVGGLVCDLMIRPVPMDVMEKGTSFMETFETNVGGDAANEAIVMAKLGNRVCLSSEIGEDGTARELRSVLDRYSVDTSFLTVRKDGKTRTNIVLISPDGERRFIVFPKEFDEFSGKDLNYDILPAVKLVSIGSIHLLPLLDESLPKYLKAAKDAGCITGADMCMLHGDHSHTVAEDCCRYLDYLMPSEAEIHGLFGENCMPEEAAKVLRGWGAKNVVIKLGEKGCYILNDEYDEAVPAFPAKAIDTTGAGDSFAGAFLTGVLKGWDLKKCAIFGTAAGCIAVQLIGANTGVKSYEQVLSVAAASPDWEE